MTTPSTQSPNVSANPSCLTKNTDTFLGALERLRDLAPPQTLIHVGAGGGKIPYSEWDISQALLIEPIKENARQLHRLCAMKPAWSLLETFIDSAESTFELELINPLAETALLPSDQLVPLWPNLKVRNKLMAQTVSLDNVLSEHSITGAKGWLFVSCLPAARILQGGLTTLPYFNVVVTRVALSSSLVNIEGASEQEVDAVLTKAGFNLVATCPEPNSALGSAFYVHSRVPLPALLTESEPNSTPGTAFNRLSLIPLAASLAETDVLAKFMQIPQDILELAESCFSSGDILESIDQILFSNRLIESQRFLFYISLSDLFYKTGNRVVAVGLLQTAKDQINHLGNDYCSLLINRLVALGEFSEATDVACRFYLSDMPGLNISYREKDRVLQGYSEIVAQSRRKIQHGHDLLLTYLENYLPTMAAQPSGRKRLLIEIGTTRESVPGQGSTRIIADFCTRHDLDFVTVDMDPHNSRMAADMFARLGMPYRAVTMKGEDFLRDHHGQFDFVFLDAYDFDHGKHSELRQSRYIKMLGAPINDADCHQMHLDCATSILAKLADGGVVCIDDTWIEDEKWTAKGALAMPYLLENDFEVLEARNRAALLKRKLTDTVLK